MKLHLPHGLRKALLACLAALTVSLPATLGSASGVAAVTIALSALTAQQTAADTTVTKNADWAAFVQDAEKNKPGEKVILQQASDGSIFFGHLVDGADVDEDIFANVEIAADLVINNGYSNTNDENGPNYTFSGAITGSGSFKVTDTIHRQHYKFTGDMSGWTGNFEITGGTGEDSIEFSGSGFVSSEGKITLTAGSNSKLIADGVTLKNSEITASLLEIRGDVTFSRSSGQTITITGATTVGQGATLTLGTNTEMHLASLADNPTLTKLTLGEGSEFGLGTGSLSIDTLELSGDNASLAMDVTGGATITLATLTANNHHLTIYLSGITDETIGTEGYALFGGSGWKAEWNDLISLVTEAGRALKVNEQGKVVWMYDLQDLTWTGSDGASLTWTDGGSGWDNNGTFHNGDSVTLTGSGGSAMQVNVTGGILTGNLTISGDNAGGFTFAAAEGGGTLHIGGNLSVSVDTAFNLEVTLDGTVTLSNDAELTVHQNFQFGAGKGLTVDGTGTFKIDLSGSSGASFDAAGYSFAEGVAVDGIASAGGWGYFKNLKVLGTLNLTGKEVVLQGTNVITNLDASGLNVDGAHITFEINTSTTFKNKVTMEAAGLDVRDGTVILEQGADVKYLDMSGGTLNVTAGGLSFADTMTVSGGTLNVSAGDLSVTGAMTMTGGSLNVTAGNLSVGGAMSLSNATVNLGGHLSAGSSTLTLGAGGKLVLQSGAATDNTLGSLTLSGNATLGFSLVGDSFTGLNLGALTLDGHTLTIDLGTELASYLAQHDGTATLTLFSGAVTSTLQQAWRDEGLVLASYGYTYEVNEQGQFVFKGELPAVTWSEANHTGNLTLIWENGNGEGRWDNGGNFTAWNKVELTGSTDAAKTITLKGAIQANSVTIGGTGSFTFGSDASGGSLEAIDITVGANADFNAGVTVVSSLTVQDGVTVNVGDTGSLRMQEGASITVGNGSNLVIAAGKLSHGGDVLQLKYSGEGNGSGAVEVKLGNTASIAGLNAAKGVTLKLTNTSGYSFFKDITAAGDVVAAGNQVILDGTNNMVNLSDGGTALGDRLVLNNGHISTTFSGNLDLSMSALDVRDGKLEVLNGKITTGKGLFSHNGSAAGYVNGKDLETTVAENATQTYGGALTLSGNLTKKGAGTQVLQGGNNNDLSVTGTVTVEAGALNWGKANLASSIGTLTVSGGTFKLLNGTLTVGSITSMSGGALQVGGGSLVLTNAGGSTLTNLALGQGTTAGNLTVNAGNFTISGGWTWGDGSSLTLGTKGQQITLSGLNGLNGETGADGHKLTINISSSFLAGVDGTTGVQLFASNGFSAELAAYFNVVVTDGGDAYSNLTLTATGKLTWGGGGNVEPTPPADGLVWNVDGPDDTWGGDGHENWGENNQAWVSGSNAVFNDGTGETVTISGAVEAGNVSVVKGTWTFAGDGSLSASGLTLQGEETSVKFTGAGVKNFGGSADSPGIHLGAGTELVIAVGGEGVGNDHWKTDGANYVEGEGSIVLEGVNVTNAGGGNGLLFAFFAPGDNTEKSIGALILRSSATLKMDGEMAGDNIQNTGHSLGYFKEIVVEAGCTLNVTSGALGYKKHGGNKLHLAGTGSENAGALIINYDASGDKAPNQQINWDIVADADALVSVVKGKTFNGALDAQGNTLTLKTAEGQTTTLKGAFTAGSKEDGTKGTLELSGGTVVLGEGFSMTGSEGTLKVSGGTVSSEQAATLGNVALEGGTLTLAAGGTASALSGTGGTLNVGGGTLTVGTVEGATLTGLALGAGETAGNLVVNGGSFAVSDGWTWRNGSSLTLGGSLQKITLNGTGWADQLAANGSKLTITLGGTFLNGVEGNSFSLFSGGGVTDFTQYFDVDLSALSTAYEGLAFNADGTLSWGEVVGPVEPGPGGDTEPEGDVFWGGGEGESGLTWGNEGGGDKFDTSADGSGDVGWQDGRNVHFLGKGGDKPRNVELAGDIKTGAFDATGTEGQAEFSFGSEGKKYLTVGGTMTVTRAKLTFTENIDLTVKGSVTLKDSDSTLSVEGVAEFKGKVGGTGTLDTGTGGKISLSSTEEGGFKGKVTGAGTLATAESGQVTLAGDVSRFEGTLDIGTGGTLTLSGAAVGDEVNVKTGGSGTLAVDGGETDVTFTGIVGGTGLTLRNAGSGELIVTSQAEDNGGGTKLDGGKGGITLGGTSKATVWSGTAVTGGDITLSNVTLAKGGLTNKASEAKVYVDTALVVGINTVARGATSQGGVVDVAGMAAENLDGITVNAYGQLKNVTGTYKAGADKQLTLHFTEENVSGDAGDADSQVLIVGAEGGKFTLDASSKSDVTLEMTDAVASILDTLSGQGGGEAYVHVLQGGTLSMGELTLSDFGGLDIFESVVKDFAATVEGGDIKLTGTVEDVYVVEGGETVDAVVPGRMRAIVFGQGKRATFTTESEATLHNLLGASGSVAQLQKGAGATGEVTFTLDNTFAGDITHADTYPEVEGSSVRGQDTVFLGSIVGDKGVNIVKSGLGTLTVGGDYTLTDGDTRLEAGALRLRGAGNRMKSLTFAYGAAPSTGEAGKEERGLQLAAGSRTELGSIVEEGESTEDNKVELTGNAELTLTGKSALASTTITGDGNGTLELGTGAGLSLNEGASISGTAVKVGDNAVLDIGTTTGSKLTKLDGSGTLKSAAGGEVTVGGGTFTGTLGSSVEGGDAGTFVVADGASFTLDNAKSEASAPGQGMDVRLGKDSGLTVKVGEKQGDGTDTLTFGDIELGGGQLTVDFGGRGINEKYVTGNVTGVGEGGVLEFVSNGTVKGDTIHTGFKVAEGLQGQEELEKFVKFSGVDNLLNDHTVGVTKDGEVVLTLQAVEENRLAGLIPGAQKNGMAGAEMMWGSLKGRSQGELLSEIFARPDSAYARLAFYLSQCYDGGADATGLDHTLAAAAGSAISTLGAALGQDVHRQLSTIRNRTTGMGGAAHGASDKLPQWHAWIQGEGNYHKLDADGLAPGYTLNSWGGTVGVDADVTRRMTVGLAVTAMYGDLKPDSVDSATGDLDTAYLSAFARVAHGAWIHTFAVSGGFADVKLDRTVSYSGGSYRTSGSTDGYALGVLYEVGYTRLMNAAGTVALQPVFNVEWRHASIDGYTESGCDAGVSTDDISQDVVTFGAGARAQFAVGANAFNHAAILETRALVKADVGDRSGTASNAMVGDTARAEVESAEVGAVGVELGAGISVPIGSDTGSVFVDGSVEFRSGWTSANATVGYRMNF